MEQMNGISREEVRKAQIGGIYCLTELACESVKAKPEMVAYYKQRLADCKSIMRKAGLR